MACLLFLVLVRLLLVFAGDPEDEYEEMDGSDVTLYGKVAEKELKTGRTVFCLSEVEGVRNTDNFAAKYLTGAYGAVPTGRWF